MGQSDRHVENVRMNPENQAWQPLDPATGSLPGEIESALGDGDSVSACVVILVDSEIDRDWGAQASVAVAKRWAASGRRIILADACLDGPVLHEAVGVENGEGVSDMVLYGASPTRITERVEGGFMLAPAGTPVIEVADVLKHVKWDMVIRGCREAGATLVFHVSTGTPGAEAITKRAEGVLVLAPRWKNVEDLLGSESGPLMGVLGPANGDAPSVWSDDERGDVAAVDVLLPPPSAEEDDALPVEALPGLPEEETPADSATVDPPETSEAFGVADLEGSQYDSDDSPEVVLEGGEAPPSLVDAEDSPAEVGVEDSLAEVGVEDSPVEVGVEALPTEEPKKVAEAKRKVPRGGGGLARLKWQKRRDALLRLLLIVTITVGVVGGGWAAAVYYGLLAVPDFVRSEGPRSYVPPPEVLPGPTPQTAIMTHVLFIDSWRTMADASAIADALQGRLPNLVFFVTPLDVNGTLQFELHIGPAYSAMDATALKEPVAVANDRENPDDWSVKEAPYAFYFGEYDSVVNAQGRIQALAEASIPCLVGWLIGDVCVDLSAVLPGGEPAFLSPSTNGIPAYALQVAYQDGTTRVRVYGGAFRDELQAEEMGRMINGADIGEMVLTSRRGTVPE